MVSRKGSRRRTKAPAFEAVAQQTSLTNARSWAAFFGGRPSVFAAAWRTTLLAGSLIVLATVAVYSNTFQAPFIFDDEASILENPTIRRLWPIGPVLCPPAHGEAVQRRPVVNLSLAINYAISGTSPWSYHALNLFAHLLAALLLFGIVRRTLSLPNFRKGCGRAATPLGLAVALLWAVHPLLTEAVTYVVQRTEVLAGLFYLLTLYCLIRGAESQKGTVPFLRPPAARIGTVPGLWYAAAVAACGLAMGSKETAISAPLVGLLYDRVFLSPSWRELFRRRWGLYLGLAATWAVVLIMLPRGYEGVAVFAVPKNPATMRLLGEGCHNYRALDYALAQFGVIDHYLRLSCWPHPLVVDYGLYTPQTAWQIVPYALLIGGLLAATLAAFRYQPWLGFLGVWFFAILAPSSSVVPLFQQIAAEKRMYLPLAAVVAGVVLGGYVGGRRLVAGGLISPPAARLTAICLVTLAGLVLAALTFHRNAAYHTVVSIWADAVARMPENARAHNNFGLGWVNLGRLDEAIAQYHKALELAPDYEIAHNNLGVALAKRGEPEQAMEEFRKALALLPDYAMAHNNLGNTLAKLHRTHEAVNEFHAALELNPQYAEAHSDLAMALLELGKPAEAVAEYQKAVEIKPDWIGARYNLAVTLARLGRRDDAIAQYEKTLKLKPDSIEARSNLANLLLEAGRTSDAVLQFQKVLEFKPELAEARYGLGAALADAGRLDEAIASYRAAVGLKPDYADAYYNLAAALAAKGRFRQAAGAYRKVIQIEPNSADACNNLARLLAECPAASVRNAAEAVALASRAVQLSAGLEPKFLDTLAAVNADAGRFSEAVRAAQQALKLAVRQGRPATAEAIRAELRLYQAGTPLRQSPHSPAKK